MILDTVGADGQALKVPGIVPKLSETPGRLVHPAPRLGQHNADLAEPGWPTRRPVP